MLRFKIKIEEHFVVVYFFVLWIWLRTPRWTCCPPAVVTCWWPCRMELCSAPKHVETSRGNRIRKRQIRKSETWKLYFCLPKVPYGWSQSKHWLEIRALLFWGIWEKRNRIGKHGFEFIHEIWYYMNYAMSAEEDADTRHIMYDFLWFYFMSYARMTAIVAVFWWNVGSVQRFVVTTLSVMICCSDFFKFMQNLLTPKYVHFLHSTFVPYCK